MKEKTTRDLYPIILKQITVDKSELVRLRRLMTIEKRIKDTIMDLIISAQTKLADREQSMWEDLAAKFGYSSFDEILNQDKIIEISWASSQINLLSKTPEDKPVS